MKRTTYILIGILISGLLIIVGGMYWFSLTGGGQNGRGITFPAVSKKMDLTGIRVVKIYAMQAETAPQGEITVIGSLSVTPAVGSVKSSISYPDTKHLHVTQKEDTLLLELNFNLYDLSKQVKDHSSFLVNNLFLNLVADSTLTYIYSEIPSLGIASKNLALDSLTVRSCGLVQLDSCVIGTFDLAGNKARFEANDSRINDFYVDLDAVRSRDFEGCMVDTEHLTGGSYRHTVNLQKDGCRQVLWTPKDEDAKLVVTFTQKASMSLQK